MLDRAHLKRKAEAMEDKPQFLPANDDEERADEKNIRRNPHRSPSDQRAVRS